jgi:choline transport protein
MPLVTEYTVMGLACAYIIVFKVIYCSAYALPVNAQTMNYSCLMFGGLIIFVSAWYLWKRTHGYVGPRVVLQANDGVRTGTVSLVPAGTGEKHA